jgi:hypothetical protein
LGDILADCRVEIGIESNQRKEALKILVRKLLLFCKKAAKNFLESRLGLFTANAPSRDSKKFFRRFFQKAVLFTGVALWAFDTTRNIRHSDGSGPQ